MLKGKTIGIDATSLEANAAMRSIVRRDTGESYMEYLRRLAVEAGLDGVDDDAVRRMDRFYTKEANDVKNLRTHTGWFVRNERTLNGAWVLPDPDDGDPDAFSGIDMAVRLYRPDQDVAASTRFLAMSLWLASSSRIFTQGQRIISSLPEGLS